MKTRLTPMLALAALLATPLLPLAAADPVEVERDGNSGFEWTTVRVHECVALCPYVEVSAMTYAGGLSYDGVGVCYADSVDYCPGYIVFVDTQLRHPEVVRKDNEDGSQTIAYRSCDSWGFPHTVGPSRCTDTDLVTLP